MPFPFSRTLPVIPHRRRLSLQICPPWWRSRVTQSRKSFSVPTDFFLILFHYFFFFCSTAHTSRQSQNHLVNCMRVVYVYVWVSVFVLVRACVCVRVCLRPCVCVCVYEILSAFSFFLFPWHFPGPLSRVRQPSVRLASYPRCSFRGIFIPETCNALETIQNGKSSHLQPPIAWKKPPARKMFWF